MKIEISRTDEGWTARGTSLMGEATLTHSSNHETAHGAARTAASVLRVWSETKGRCEQMEHLWLVLGESDKMDDFAFVVPAATRLGAAEAVARALKLPCSTSRDYHCKLHVIVNSREEYPVGDGWEVPRWFWSVGVAPLTLGADMNDDKMWSWGEEIIE